MSAGTLVQSPGTSTPLLWVPRCSTWLPSVLAVGAGARWRGLHRHHPLVFALLWAIVVLSIAAVLIMLWLLQREAAAQVSSLFFLTPALSTVEGAVLFGESVGPFALAGLLVALVGVSLTMRSTR
jgi:drug/metabolite transporter (DMT)-like permease